MDDTVRFVNQTLEQVRVKLLDLTRRNTLLNFWETRRMIRVIDELADEVFRFLVTDGKAMELLPFYPPKEANHPQRTLPFKNREEVYNSNNDSVSKAPTCK